MVDAITGTDETAYKSLDVGKRDTVVKNVLRWGKSQSSDYLKIFFRETDLNRTGQISLAEFKQMVIRWDAIKLNCAKLYCLMSQIQLCKRAHSVCLLSPPHLRTPLSVWRLEKPDQSIYQVARLRQQLQDQALDCHRCRLLQITVKQIFTSLTCHKYTCCR